MSGLSNPTRIAVLIVTAIIILAPAVTVDAYSIVANPISQLGAQDAPHAWIMRTGLVVLGAGPAIDAWHWRRHRPFATAGFLLFAAAMVATAVFSARPVDPVVPFDVTEDRIHTAAAILAGYAFAFGAVCFAFRESGRWRKAACLFAAAMAAFMPMAMHANPDILGLLQRIMLATCFTWLFVFMPQH